VRCDIQQLAHSGIPVLALIGSDETPHDAVTMADRLRRKLPGATVIVINDANHLIFTDQQAAVAQQLGKFLRR